MIDLNLLTDPDRISLAKLASRENVHLSTCIRWATGGVAGHVLPTAKHGGRRVTSLTAYRNWQAAVNGQPVPFETPAREERRLRDLERKADEMDITLD
jgi:hypothetical protein